MSVIPVGNKWAVACEQWWLYWKFSTAASLKVWCTNSQLLKNDTRRKNYRSVSLWLWRLSTRLCSRYATIDYLARLWQPTPWGPHRQRWLGNGAWGGSVPPATPPCHEVPAAALIGCCWTVPRQSRALPVQMLAAKLTNIRRATIWQKQFMGNELRI